MIGTFVASGLYATFGLTPRPGCSGWSAACMLTLIVGDARCAAR